MAVAAAVVGAAVGREYAPMSRRPILTAPITDITHCCERSGQCHDHEVKVVKCGHACEREKLQS